MNWIHGAFSVNATVNWINVAGYVVEIAGLGFLFFDLFRTKERDQGADAVSAFQKSLESGGREIVIGMYDNFKTIMRAVSQFISLDMDKAIPAELRHGLIEVFDKATAKLDGTDINEMVAKELVAKASIVASFQKQERAAERLRRIVTAGVALVLIGASLQLLSLFISA
jgi:hypothetical protein